MPKLKYTLDEYFRSPAGKGNASASQLLAVSYKDKYNRLMVRYNSTIKRRFFTDKTNYYIHLSVPSEVVPDFFYDVVFKFSPSSGSDTHSSKLDKYNVEFFSNDPAFTFTYAYAYNQAGILIEELSSKFGDVVLKTKPKERNPFGVVNFAKILYFGALYIRQHGLLMKDPYETSNLRVSNLRDFIKPIMDASEKATLRQEAQVDLEKKDVLAKHRKLKADRTANGNGKQIRYTKFTNKVKANNISTVKRVKTTRRK